MILAEVVTWFLIILGCYLVLVAHWLGAVALFPRVVDRAAERYARRPVLGTLLGLAVAIPVVVLYAMLMGAIGEPVLKGLVGSLALVPVLLAMLGSAGLVQRIGAGLGAPVDAGQPWRRCLRGGLVLGICFLPPFLGWLLFGWVVVSGFGIALMSLLVRDPVPAAERIAARAAGSGRSDDESDGGAGKPAEVPA